MSRARAKVFAVAGLCTALATCGGGRAARHPDVVLIVVDTLRRDHLSCYGHTRPTSPAIDALAADGVRFEYALAQAPWTTPSTAALLTSRLPEELGISTIRSAVPQDALLLAEILGQAGYRTDAVVSHHFVSARWGFDQGFDTFDDSNALGHDAVTSPAVTARALERLAAAAQDERPFFLWVHYFDPHFAYIDHAEHALGGAAQYAGPVESGMDFSMLRGMQQRLDADDLAELERLYDAEIAFTDRHIGLLLERLRQLGRYDGALIVLTADHGEEFLEHGGLGHGPTLYDEVVRVPLIVKYPARAAAGVIETAVALLDVVPTVLDVARVESSLLLHGRSLRGPHGDLLDDGAGARSIPTATTKAGGLRAVVSERHKLIRRASGEHELYDLQRDPLEQQDLVAAGSAGPILGRLSERLDGWLRGASAAPPTQLELDPGDVRRLAELGYTDSDPGSSGDTDTDNAH